MIKGWRKNVAITYKMLLRKNDVESLVSRFGGNSMLSFMVININPNEIVDFNKKTTHWNCQKNHMCMCVCVCVCVCLLP
jgi:hypothetical protein